MLYNDLIRALTKKALGNEIVIITEEQIFDEEGKPIGKPKKTIKTTKNDIDTSACLKLLDIEERKREGEKITNLSDDELQKKKEQLIIKLMQEEGYIKKRSKNEK